MAGYTRSAGENDADKKLMELSLYVADKCETDPYFGATKLNKVLFWADMLYYAKTGTTITGAEYQRIQFGPAPRRMLPVLTRLKDESRGVVRPRATQKGTQKRLVPLDNADLSLFSGAEIAWVDQVIDWVDGQCADELSDRTHEDATWKFARDGETINPNAIFISNDPISKSEAQVGFKEAKEQGLA